MSDECICANIERCSIKDYVSFDFCSSCCSYYVGDEECIDANEDICQTL